MRISLTHAEVMQAAQAGIMRLVGNMKRGFADKYGTQKSDRWGIDIEGACGEMAVAKYLRRYWSGTVGIYDAADVGTLQVRTTSHVNGCLILHPQDSDDHVFVLVTGRAPDFVIQGWIWGREGKLSEWWTDFTGRPAFFVPQDVLSSIESLPEVREAAE